jgi:hypothetical protein
MPAAIRTRPPRLSSPRVIRHREFRPRHSPMRGFSPRAYPATRVLLRTRRGRRPESNRIRSSLTFGQPFSANLAMPTGPCDPGNRSAAREVGRRFSQSHGPAVGTASALGLTLPYRSTGWPFRLLFSFPPRGIAGDRRGSTPGRPTVAASRRLCPIEPAAAGRRSAPWTCPDRSTDTLPRPIEPAAAGRWSRSDSTRPAARELCSKSRARGLAARHEGIASLKSRARQAEI